MNLLNNAKCQHGRLVYNYGLYSWLEVVLLWLCNTDNIKCHNIKTSTIYQYGTTFGALRKTQENEKIIGNKKTKIIVFVAWHCSCDATGQLCTNMKQT